MKRIAGYAAWTILTVAGWLLWWKASHEVALLTAANREADHTIGQLRKDVWDYRNKATAAAAISTSPAHATVDAQGSVQKLVDDWITMMNNPEAQRLVSLQRKAQISSRYAGMFRTLELSPEQVERFKELLLERQNGDNDILAISLQNGINPLQNPAEYAALATGMHEEVEKKIESALGTEKYAKLANYQASQQNRAVVKQLEDSLSYSEEPLTREQRDQFQRVLVETGPTKAGMGNPNGTVTDKTTEQSKEFLGETQLKALEEIKQGQAAEKKLADMKKKPGDNSTK